MGAPKYRIFTFAVQTPDGEELISFRSRRVSEAEEALKKAFKVRGFASNTKYERFLRKGEKK